VGVSESVGERSIILDLGIERSEAAVG